MAADAKNNSKVLYSYISNRCKVQSKVGPLKDKDGVVQTDDSIHTKILKKKSPAFTQEDLSSMPTLKQMFDPAFGSPLTSLSVTPNIVADRIKVLKQGALGPDNI